MVKDLSGGESSTAQGDGPATGSRATPTAQTPFASESGHWYLQDGTPFYTVPAAWPKMERPATLRDARKVEAVPSVTTILKSVAAPALENYKANEILKAAWEIMCADWHGSFEAYALAVLQESREHARKAAEEGKALHARLEGEPNERFDEHYELVHKTLVQCGINIVMQGSPEFSFAHSAGFGGKVDWHSCRDAGVVIDYKTKATIVPGKRMAYDNHCQQLAAYREGLVMQGARCLNVFVGIDPPMCVIHEWSEKDIKRGWKMFKLILRYWQLQHNYEPKGH
jgi:hypothetical protein